MVFRVELGVSTDFDIEETTATTDTAAEIQYMPAAFEASRLVEKDS